MRIPLDKAVFVLKLLLEGTSINATVRLTGIAKETILDLLVMVGNRAMQFWQDRMKGLSCNECQVDEVWGFVGMKEKTRVRKDRPEIFGDAYAFTAIDRETKLLLAFHVGKRTYDDAQWFCNLLAEAVDGDLQLTTDGFTPYCVTVVEAFRHRVNFAQLIKIFGPSKNPGAGTYTPSEIKRTRTRVIIGKPERKQSARQLSSGQISLGGCVADE